MDEKDECGKVEVCIDQQEKLHLVKCLLCASNSKCKQIKVVGCKCIVY